MALVIKPPHCGMEGKGRGEVSGKIKSGARALLGKTNETVPQGVKDVADRLAGHHVGDDEPDRTNRSIHARGEPCTRNDKGWGEIGCEGAVDDDG